MYVLSKKSDESLFKSWPSIILRGRCHSLAWLCWLYIFLLTQPTSASLIRGNAWKRPSPSSWALFWPLSLWSHSLSTTSTWKWQLVSLSSPETAPCTRTCKSAAQHWWSQKLSWQKTGFLDVQRPQRKRAIPQNESLIICSLNQVEPLEVNEAAKMKGNV